MRRKLETLRKCKVEDKYFQPRNFNTSQSTWYLNAMFGLSRFSKEELSLLPLQERKQIQEVHIKAQYNHNIWKQEIVSRRANGVLLFYFPESNNILDIVRSPLYDPQYINNMKFIDLGLRKEHVTRKLIELGVFPKDFLILSDGKKKENLF